MSTHHKKPRIKASASSVSQRQLRVGEVVRRVLIEVLAREDFYDDVLAGCSITLSEVRVSPDLRHALVFAAPLSGVGQGEMSFEAMEKVIAALNKRVGFFRKELAKNLHLRYTPAVRFNSDTSFETAAYMENLLANLNTP